MTPVLVRRIVGVLGGATVAGVTAVVALEKLDVKVALLAFAAAFGGSLIGALKTLPDTVRIADLPRGWQNFLVGDKESLPPVVQPMTTVGLDDGSQ